MSVNMAKADGVTVLTLTADPQSPCPPLCQILKGLCYSPFCCSVSQHMRRVQRNSQSVLGALHIMIGMVNIGLVLILNSSPGNSWNMAFTGFPFWLAGLFILFGVMSILSEKFPSPCLVTINVILNLAGGVPFTITAGVLYSLNMGEMWFGGPGWWWGGMRGCEYSDYYYRHNGPRDTWPQEDFIKEKCLESTALVLMILRSINVVLIVLLALELCVIISSAVVGIKALRSWEKRDDKNNNDPEHYQPLQEEVTSKSAA